MATTILRTPPNLRACVGSSNCNSSSSPKSRKFQCVSLVQRRPNRSLMYRNLKFPDVNGNGGVNLPCRLGRFIVYASNDAESTEIQTETKEEEEVEEPNNEGNEAAGADVEDTVDGESADVGPDSVIIASLQMYREALATNDESKVAEIEIFLKSIEDEKNALEKKLATLTEEFSNERDRVLRISADFDNFRKRTERERLSLVSNAQGEVAESLLPVLDNFERAKAQIKIETDGEEKINNSYQSIYKQFVEILVSLGVVPVETIGKPFDPMLHEAIMREDSTEFEEGVIIEEYRKGFKLGDRLLRPAMVKVSAGPGPGPAKPETGESSEEPLVSVNETTQQETVVEESAEE